MMRKSIDSLLVLLLSAGIAGAAEFSTWSAPVNLGSTINSPSGDVAPSLSKDGLSLFFFSDRPGGYGGNDIWVSHREDVNSPWEAPRNLGPGINTSGNENAPTLSLDGHRLYFASDSPGGFGGLDLYVARRRDKRDDLDWSAPENLGSGINTSADEAGAAFFESDETGGTTAYFHSNRSGNDDIYASELGPEETFGPASAVDELNTPFLERLPSVRRDGLELYISSNRPGTIGALDLWVATRESVKDRWSTPVNVGSVVNSSSVDGRAWLSFDGTAMYFNSTRSGGQGSFDLYMTTRMQVKPSSH